ncbi:hypothetical protein GCM10027288_34570 [Bordetella tumbae]|uniref:DUF4148 domain-containing protein n=1 Tax=Bordetella tumbae TaxID=1649139 RepID=UPI0039EE1C3B
MKTQFAIFAIALSASFAGTAAHAAEETYVPPSVSTLSRAEVTADLAAAKAAGNVQPGDQTYIPVSPSTLSRAEVKADLAAWKHAGLSSEWRGNATPDIYSTAYRTKLAVYEYSVASQASRVASVS